MGEDTKKQALVKLAPSPTASATPTSGATIRNLEIVRGDALGNSQRANQNDLQRRLNKIGNRSISATGRIRR